MPIVQGKSKSGRDFTVAEYDAETKEVVIRLSVDVEEDEVLAPSSSGKSLHIVNAGPKTVRLEGDDVPSRVRGEALTFNASCYMPNPDYEG